MSRNLWPLPDSYELPEAYTASFADFFRLGSCCPLRAQFYEFMSDLFDWPPNLNPCPPMAAKSISGMIYDRALKGENDKFVTIGPKKVMQPISTLITLTHEWTILFTWTNKDDFISKTSPVRGCAKYHSSEQRLQCPGWANLAGLCASLVTIPPVT